MSGRQGGRGTVAMFDSGVPLGVLPLTPPPTRARLLSACFSSRAKLIAQALTLKLPSKTPITVIRQNVR